MSARAVRRLVVAVVVALGFLDIVLAATPHRRGGAPALGPLRIAEAVGGPRYLLLVAGVSLLVATPALRGAKRKAWSCAVALSAASALGHHLRGMDMVGLLASVVAMGLLLATASRFPVPPDPVQTQRAWALLALGEAVVLAYGVGGLLLLDAGFTRGLSLPAAVEDGLRLLLLLPATMSQPATRHGVWFVDSVRFLSLGVALAGLTAVLRAAVVGPAGREADRQRVATILRRWGTTTLAPFHLLDDKAWFFGSDGQAFVSYKVVGRVAVALGAPVGSPPSRAAALGEFLEHCHLNGWVPAFHQVEEADRPLLEGYGLHLLEIGQEAVIPVDAFTLEGHEKKALRSALRRVARSAHRIEELAQPIDDVTMDQLHQVSDAWLSSGGHRERTFTVGQFEPEYLRQTRVFVVRDGDDRIVAFVNVVPGYACDVGNFDLMRRRPDAVNGVMEFLLVGLIERFREEGKRAVTLGLAPLANIKGDTVVDRVLRLLREYGVGAFSFGGLAGFKSRWAPVWEARYMAYLSQLDLPRIAVAVARAGELGSPPTVTRRCRQIVRRFPFSSAVVALELWLMIVTSLDPLVERFLLRQFGVSWPALVDLQWWRLVTATLVEPRAGVLWGNVVLLAMVPVAEWRLGPRRTVSGFFLGDWLSTVPVLVGLRVLGALGSSHSLATALGHDAGPSAAAYALVAAAAATIPGRRVRVLALAAVFISVLWPLAMYPRLYDLQHLVSVTVGTGLGLLWAPVPVAVRRWSPAVAARTPG